MAKLVNDVASLAIAFCVLGGNYNCPLNPLVDQKPRNQKASRKTTGIHHFCYAFCLHDVWRIMHQNEKDLLLFRQP